MLVKEETRQLARIVAIDALLPIKKADRIELAVIGGWECIVAKGLHQVGNPALYLEIDAAIAVDNPVFGDFDTARMKKTLDEATGAEYIVVKTMRLRGALSQGLLLSPATYANSAAAGKKIGTDVTELLGVLKYVSPEEAKLYRVNNQTERDDGVGAIRKFWNKMRNKLVDGIVTDGLQPFPLGHTKSEEERIQNIGLEYLEMVASEAGAEVTIKFDGESAMFFTDLNTSEIGAAQRNFSLRTQDVPYSKKDRRKLYVGDWMRFISRRLAGGACPFPQMKKGYIAQSAPLVAYFHRQEIGRKLSVFNATTELPFAKGKMIAVQGEMVGPDFNRNNERASVNQFFIYRVYVNGRTALLPEQARQVAAELGMAYIPVVDANLKVPASKKDLLKLADGPGHFDKTIPREGFVVKDNVTGKSCKVISNKWLEKKGKEDVESEVSA